LVVSRINIIIIGLLSSIFLIFSCISLNLKHYYLELNPHKVKHTSKSLSPVPKITLKDREVKEDLCKSTSSICEVVDLEDKNLTHLSNDNFKPLLKKGIFSKDEKKVSSLVSIEKSDLKKLSNPFRKSSINELELKISRLLEEKPIRFKKNSGTVNREGREILDEIITLLFLEKSNFIIEIYGHTDAGGKRKINRFLSQKRADEVKKYLIEKGFPSKKINSVGFGEESLLLKDKPYSHKNRRVEIHIKRKE